MPLQHVPDRVALVRAILGGELDTVVARRAAQLGWRAPEPAEGHQNRLKLA